MPEIQKIVGVDTETTGPSPAIDRVVSATVIVVDRDLVGTKEWLVNPEMEIVEGASEVHGITNSIVKEDGQDRREAIVDIVHQLSVELDEKDTVLMGYNLPFDLTILRRECEELNFPWDPRIEERVIDPYALNALLNPKFKFDVGKETLENVAKFYGLDPEGSLHDSTVDTKLAVELGLKMLGKHEELKGASINVLMEAQRDAFKKRSDGMFDWMKRQAWFDPAKNISMNEWPIWSQSKVEEAKVAAGVTV